MEKGKKVIIATHGYLADGFVSALNIIVGDMKDLKAMCCYTSPDFNLDNQITQMMENHDFEKEDLVICTDILGGSVNNGFVKFLGTYPFHLIDDFLIHECINPLSFAMWHDLNISELFSVVCLLQNTLLQMYAYSNAPKMFQIVLIPLA